MLALTCAVLAVALFGCGGSDTTKETEAPPPDPIDLASGQYKIVYDLADANAISDMVALQGELEKAVGTKPGSLSSGSPATEYEIQFGLKTGRAESESLYNTIKDYAGDRYGAYSLQTVGNHVVIVASDRESLKVASARFIAAVAECGGVIASLDETALVDLEAFRYGRTELVFADEFADNALLAEITVGGYTIIPKEGTKEYFRPSEGKTDFPEIEVKAKYPSTKVEVTKEEDRYEIKTTCADGSKEELYTMNFIQTPKLDSFDLDTWLTPYWDGCITYHESVMFVGDDGAPLLYTPEHILSVRSYDLKTEYVEGVDYEVRDGKLFKLAGSKMPSYTWDEFYPKSKETSVSGNAFAGSKKPFVVFSEGSYFHEHQVFVTYTHQPNDSLFVPTESTKLTKFEQKLERGESVNLVFFGDSITAGGNASGRAGVLPNTPIWSEMVRDALAAKYPNAKINYTNTAVGGKETVWAIEELEARVNAYKPDLLVLAFGMNDGGKQISQFISNTKTIIDRVRAANPGCEIAVIATMLPHEETTYFKNQYEQEAALKELAKSYTDVDVIPMTSVHSSILSSKRYFDMTGNNVNHPNDFLIRIYAQTILKTIVG